MAGQPRATAQAILATARQDDCANPPDILAEILCAKVLTVGLRASYPGFSRCHRDGTLTGFEVDIAQAIADFLGVTRETLRVDPKSRIPAVVRRQADIALATIGHDRLRDTQARFIRPHYYASRTALVGPRGAAVRDWSDLADETVCVPLGASSNMIVAGARVRLLIFDTPRQLADALNFGRCRFAVHDDAFFWQYRDDPTWSGRFEIKFTIAPLRWSTITANRGSDRLADILTLLSLAWHLDGTFQRLAAARRINTDFLEAERQHWLAPICIGPKGYPNPGCLAPPAATLPDLATPFAHHIARLEAGLASMQADGIDLSALKHQAMFDQLLHGVGISIILVIGAITMTMVCSIGVATALVSPRRWLRWPVMTLTTIGQTAPLPLLMFFGYVLAGGLAEFIAPRAVLVSILVLASTTPATPAGT